MVWIDPELLQQWWLILKPVCVSRGPSVRGRRLTVWYEHLPGVWRVLSHVAGLVSSTVQTTRLSIVKLLELLLLQLPE